MPKIMQVETYEDLTRNFDEFLKGTVQGEIKLPVPVVNITQWNNQSSNPYALALNISEKDMDALIYYGAVVITNPKKSNFKTGTVISTKEYDTYKQNIFNIIPNADISDNIPDVLYGADAVNYLLMHFDFTTMLKDLREKEHMAMIDHETIYDSKHTDDPDFTEEEQNKLMKIRVTLQTIRATIDAVYYVHANKQALTCNTIRLFPVSLMHIIKQAYNDHLYMDSQLIRTYQKILSRTKRINKLAQLGAPEIIMLNERRMLQEAVDALVANGCRGKAACESYQINENTDVDSVPYLSLSDITMRYLQCL